MIIVIWPSVATWMKAFMDPLPGPGAPARARPKSIPTSSPPAMAMPLRNSARRVMAGLSGVELAAGFSLRSGSMLDPLSDSNIRPATTDISCHRGIDIAIIGVWIVSEQGGGRHDLTGLTVATLNHFKIEPGLLDLGSGAAKANALNRCDRAIADEPNRKLTRSNGYTVDMDGAGAAKGNPATKLGPRHLQDIPQNPQ